MLSSAIEGNVDIYDESRRLTKKDQNDKAHALDKLLLSLARTSKHKVTNRESRTVIADLFDISKLESLREVFEEKNLSDRHDGKDNDVYIAITFL